mgnify:CR=1 FL=1
MKNYTNKKAIARIIINEEAYKLVWVDKELCIRGRRENEELYIVMAIRYEGSSYKHYKIEQPKK